MDVFNNMLGTQKAPESSIHLTIISVTELAYPARYAETPLFVRMTHGPKEYTTTERYVHDEHGALWEEDFSIVVSPGHDILALDVCCILNGEEKTIGGVPLPLEQIMPEEQELMSGVFDAENKHAGVLRILTSWPESGAPDQPDSSNTGGAAVGALVGGGEDVARATLFVRALRRQLCAKRAWRAIGKWRRATIEARFAADRADVANTVRELSARIKDAMTGELDETGARMAPRVGAMPSAQLRAEVAALMVEFAQLEVRGSLWRRWLRSARAPCLTLSFPTVCLGRGARDALRPSPPARAASAVGCGQRLRPLAARAHRPLRARRGRDAEQAGRPRDVSARGCFLDESRQRVRPGANDEERERRRAPPAPPFRARDRTGRGQALAHGE